MIFKYLKSKRASTLTMTLVAVSVISLIGMVTISMAVFGYKARIFDKQQKANFYLAESGTEETYAKLTEIINSAIDLGNQCIEDFENDSFSLIYSEYFDIADYEIYKDGFTAFIEDEKSKVMKGETSLYVNTYLEIDEAAVGELLNSMFKSVYKKYTNDNLPSTLDITTYKSIPDLNRFDIIAQLKPFDDVSDPINADIYNIDIRAMTYNEDKDPLDPERYKSKEINIKFQLKVPSYGDTYKTVSNEAMISESPLWSKALIADKAIIVKGSGADVTVNGDVYAYGVKPISYEASKLPQNYEGILLDSEGVLGGTSQLVINGNVATDSYIMPTKNNSKISIAGNVFCNSLAIPAGIDTATIDITGNKNVYAADDIELNGTKSIISIDGNYYGFEDGEAGHDKSSSIVINSPDIDSIQGSMVKVTGEVFLAGTVYINTNSPVPEEMGYQTGESIAIRKGGNPDNPDITNFMAYFEDYALKDDAGLMAPEDTRYLGSSIEFLNYPPLYLAYNFSQLTEEPVERFFKAKTRSYYSYLFYKYKDEPTIVNPEFKLNLDTNNNIQLDYNKVIYSLGNIISSGSMYPQKLLMEVEYDNYRNSFKNYYNFYVNKLATISKHIPTISYDDIKTGISDYVSFVNFDNLSLAIQNYMEIVFVHDDNKPLLIRGRMGDIPTDLTGTAGIDYYVKDLGIENELKGIVITTGDVYITGELNYYGTIITTGNIYIIDSNKKTFNNTYGVQQYLWNKIYNTNINTTTTLYSIFKNSSLYEDIAGEVMAYSTAETMNIYDKYENLLTIAEWKKIK